MLECTKIKFSKKNAQTRLNELRKEGNLDANSRIYPCPICSWWHLTHKEKGMGGKKKLTRLSKKEDWDKLIEKT